MSIYREHIQKSFIDVLTKKRSPKWRKVRKAFVKQHNYCAACGSQRKLEVHHIKDFSTYPDLELDWENLITLCRSGTQCHLTFGHIGIWRSLNTEVIKDSLWYREKVKNRR